MMLHPLASISFLLNDVLALVPLDPQVLLLSVRSLQVKQTPFPKPFPTLPFLMLPFHPFLQQFHQLIHFLPLIIQVIYKVSLFLP